MSSENRLTAVFIRLFSLSLAGAGLYALLRHFFFSGLTGAGSLLVVLLTCGGFSIAAATAIIRREGSSGIARGSKASHPQDDNDLMRRIIDLDSDLIFVKD